MLRFLNLITSSVSLFCGALFRVKRGDIVIVVTNPPLLPYLIALACKANRAKFALLVHDVYPDVFIRLGIMSETNVVARLMMRMSVWLYNASDRVIVLGRDMKSLATARVRKGKDRVVIATNWGDTRTIFPIRHEENNLLRRLKLSYAFVVQYCGNIGRTHGIEDIAAAAALLLDDADIKFLVIGWGAKKSWLTEQKHKHGLENVTVCDPLPETALCDGLNACNVSIISFTAGMSGISVPSRMYNVLAAGKPIIAVCDDDSELAAVVREERIGWVIPPGRPDLLALTLRQASKDPAELLKMGERSRMAAVSKYTVGAVVRVYEKLLSELNNL